MGIPCSEQCEARRSDFSRKVRRSSQFHYANGCSCVERKAIAVVGVTLMDTDARFIVTSLEVREERFGRKHIVQAERWRT